MLRITDGNNAYLYSREDMDQIEKINDSLRKIAPMLPSYDDDIHSSAQKSKIGFNKDISSYDHSKFLNDDRNSIHSIPLTVASRRSNFTLLTLQSKNTALTKLPKERKLRQMAE